MTLTPTIPTSHAIHALACAVLALAFTAPQAAPLATLDPPPAVAPAGRPIHLTAAASRADRPLRWSVVAGPTPDITPDADGSGATLPAPAAGTYTVKVVALLARPDGSLDADADKATFRVEGAEPPPPAVGRLFLSYWYDARNPTPADADVRLSPTLRAAVAALDAPIRFYDVNSADPRLAPFRAPVRAAGGPPCLLVQAAEGPRRGRVLKSLPHPGTVDIVNAVRALRAPAPRRRTRRRTHVA